MHDHHPSDASARNVHPRLGRVELGDEIGLLKCMLLQSKDRFDEIMELTQPSGGVRLLSKKLLPAPVHTQGSYSKLNGHWLALYVHNDELTVHCDQQAYLITAAMRSAYQRGDEKCTFQLLEGDRILFRVEYGAPEIDPPLEGDPTPFVEEEDFDFGLFLHNVLRSPARRIAFLDQNR